MTVNPGFCSYSMTKHAVVALTEALSLDLRTQGIGNVGVTIVMPGVVQSSIMFPEKTGAASLQDSARDATGQSGARRAGSGDACRRRWRPSARGTGGAGLRRGPARRPRRRFAQFHRPSLAGAGARDRPGSRRRDRSLSPLHRTLARDGREGECMTYDLIVVGGGIGGSALAAVMARAGKSVLLLEKSTAYEDRVRGEWIAPWGVAETRRLGLYDTLVAAGGTT
ncbi:SDR family NAD(P)-dependent oxidoreductase [Sphingomonas sp. MMS24-JH45]